MKALRDIAPADLERSAGLLDAETFRRIRHVVTENDRVLQTVELLGRAGPGALGPLLDASLASMRDDFAISCAELDLAVDTARSGGAALALAPAGAGPAVRTAVERAFARAGYTAPDIFSVRPAGGAMRLA